MRRSGWVVLCALSACNVPEPPSDTGGIEPPPLDGAHPSCGRGLMVIKTDYQSSSVALLDREGEVLSAAFLSSASTRPGLSLPLGGDVVSPSERAEGDELVLIDRHPASVLSWVDLRTAAVRAQLSVATGFSSNPHDYVTMSTGEAWVTRFEPNRAGGNAPFDQGSDLLVLDTRVPSIRERIDLSPAMAGEARRFSPGPDRALRVGPSVYVLLEGYSQDFTESAASQLARIDTKTRTIVTLRRLDPLHGCGGIALSTDQSELAVFCSGEFGGTSNPSLETSGIVRVRLDADLSIVRRHSAQELGGRPIAFAGAYPSSDRLVYLGLGRFAAPNTPVEDDVLAELDLGSAEHRELLRSGGTPYTLGDVRCPGDCGLCFVTDAGRSQLHRYRLAKDALRYEGALNVDDRSGLPPRNLGVY